MVLCLRFHDPLNHLLVFVNSDVLDHLLVVESHGACFHADSFFEVTCPGVVDAARSLLATLD